MEANQEKLETEREAYPERIEAVLKHYDGVPRIKSMHMLANRTRFMMSYVESLKDGRSRREARSVQNAATA
jgi:hypothetical protein